MFLFLNFSTLFQFSLFLLFIEPSFCIFFIKDISSFFFRYSKQIFNLKYYCVNAFKLIDKIQGAFNFRKCPSIQINILRFDSRKRLFIQIHISCALFNCRKHIFNNRNKYFFKIYCINAFKLKQYWAFTSFENMLSFKFASLAILLTFENLRNF